MQNEIDTKAKYEVSSNAGWITILIPLSFFLFIILASICLCIICYNLFKHTLATLDKLPLIALLVSTAFAWICFQFIQKKGGIITASDENIEINCDGKNHKLDWKEIKKIQHIFHNLFIIRLKSNGWFFFIVKGRFLAHIGPFAFGSDPFIEFIKARIE
jgi:hypothetical protein